MGASIFGRVEGWVGGWGKERGGWWTGRKGGFGRALLIEAVVEGNELAEVEVGWW